MKRKKKVLGVFNGSFETCEKKLENLGDHKDTI